ncbi:CatB-related O-acetyltransferase [Thalassococcus sp. S3]|uniref:CatB-related O-acetyltransferase n=1 Tax=Thalassococcus sp. S3 TaxID=2017482 RepID=UPI00102491ED|nr:CatB-related O-acetyltransferase [Thalassococcus sp. S3]QBF30055.1 acetyltransferase [Thalassococcus sp. S3]
MLPPADTLHPVRLPDGSVYPGSVFLKNAVGFHPRVRVGDYTYHSTFDPPADPVEFAARLFPYLSPNAPEQVIIGKFCQIAHGVRIITQTANHRMDGPSTYPFAIFEADRIGTYRGTLPRGRDVIIGHDCWLGDGCTILPGAQLGNGVIVGADAVVKGRISDYSVVAGNPGEVVRTRFSPQEIETLNHLCWWDWPIEKIAACEELIVGGDVAKLAACDNG